MALEFERGLEENPLTVSWLDGQKHGFPSTPVDKVSLRSIISKSSSPILTVPCCQYMGVEFCCCVTCCTSTKSYLHVTH